MVKADNPTRDADDRKDEIRSFWDNRARLGRTSGSNDFILKDLETEVIFRMIKPASRVLDVGCGNGTTLIALAQKNGCTGAGVDFSVEMISLANRYRQEAGLGNEVMFKPARMPGGLQDMELFDYAFSQRCLVNLTTTKDQRQAFEEIMLRLIPGGFYIMIEDSQQGLDALNDMRGRLDLDPIPVPWHNLFLDEHSVSDWENDEFRLVEGPRSVASTYYFLSRVIYAKLASNQGIKPEDMKYNSEINLLAYRLPQDMGNLGAPKIWIWQRGT